MSKQDINDVICLWNEFTEILGDMDEKYVDKELDDDQKNRHCEFVLKSENCKVFVMEESEKVVGFVEVCINEKDFDFHLDRYGYVAYYYVKPSYREAQMMFRLYKAAEEWVIEKGVHYICSDVDGKNEVSKKVQERLLGLEPFKIRMMKEL